MRTPAQDPSPTEREKEELMDEVEQIEKLAASIRERMRRLRGKEDSAVTSITARMRRLELPDPDE